MMFTTPAVASAPYTAEAPSFKISMRSIIATGKRLRSTKVVPPLLEPVSTCRRPFTMTRVLLAPRSRRFKAVEPRTAAVVPPSLIPMEPASGNSRKSSVKLLRPAASISARPIIRTGDGPSNSARLIREPVTSYFSSLTVSSFFSSSFGAAG